MSTRLDHIIDRFAGARIVVIGESILDAYLIGSTHRLCREAPVPVVDLARHVSAAGGAANTAANLARLGADVTFLSAVGDDETGARLRASLAEAGVDPSEVITEARRATLAKHRVFADSQLVVRFDAGSHEPLGEDAERRLIARLRAHLPECDAIVVSDYGYGILTPAVVAELGRLQAATPRVLVVDAKHLRAYRRVGVTAVKPNFGEAIRLLGHGPGEREDRAAWVADNGQRILDVTGASIAAVTVDTEGAVVFERARAPYRIYARPANNSRAAGAGDTFTSVLALALAAGAHSAPAAELAAAAAAIVVAKDGTTTCSLAELREHFSLGVKILDDPARLRARLDFHRQQGHTTVFTNGCFDILHGGHITYLNRAKALGDILIVGLNTDETIRRLKGASRPINPLAERAQVLSALSCIDYIVPFAEETPAELIRVVHPDVFVKGGDYRRESLPEASTVEELGGRVMILPYVANRSTTSIIERIQRLGLEAGGRTAGEEA